MSTKNFATKFTVHSASTGNYEVFIADLGNEAPNKQYGDLKLQIFVKAIRPDGSLSDALTSFPACVFYAISDELDVLWDLYMEKKDHTAFKPWAYTCECPRCYFSTKAKLEGDNSQKEPQVAIPSQPAEQEATTTQGGIPMYPLNVEGEIKPSANVPPASGQACWLTDAKFMTPEDVLDCRRYLIEGEDGALLAGLGSIVRQMSKGIFLDKPYTRDEFGAEDTMITIEFEERKLLEAVAPVLIKPVLAASPKFQGKDFKVTGSREITVGDTKLPFTSLQPHCDDDIRFLYGLLEKLNPTLSKVYQVMYENKDLSVQARYLGLRRLILRENYYANFDYITPVKLLENDPINRAVLRTAKEMGWTWETRKDCYYVRNLNFDFYTVFGLKDPEACAEFKEDAFAWAKRAHDEWKAKMGKAYTPNHLYNEKNENLVRMVLFDLWNNNLLV